MTRRFVKIGDVTTGPETWNPHASTSDGTFSYIDIGSVSAVEKRIISTSILRVSEAPSRARQLVRHGDVLVSTVRPNLNAVAIVPPQLDGATASTGFTVLRSNGSTIHDRYLYHWVRSGAFVRQMIARATGASYPAVTDAAVRDSRLPLPDIAEQRDIAAALDRADAIRRKRGESVRLVDELLRSAFLKMFGDPVRNERAWPTLALGEIANVDRGKFTPRPRDDPRFYGGSLPFIQTGDLSTSDGTLRRWRQTLNEDGARVSRLFPAGTIAIAIAANIGDTAIVDFAFYCPDSVVGIVPNRDITNAEFLEYCVRLYRPTLEARAPMTAQRNINLQVLRPLRIPMPPKEQQSEFADIRRRAARFSDRLLGASCGLEQLWQSLAETSFGNASET